MKRRDFCKSAAAAGALGYLPLSKAMSAVSLFSGGMQAVSIDGAETTLQAAQVDEFSRSLQGPLLVPGDGAYDVARRLWNGMVDKHPAMIARCETEGDIVSAVQFASSNNLLVAIKGGGHSFPGKSSCNGGLMIDLSGMRAVELDAERKTVTAQPGALGADLDTVTLPHDLVVPTGTISHTGIAGLTLGGGFAFVSRRFGLACDNLLSVDIVTADGQLRHASADQNPDLFWAIRGGGGNFGVVTSFKYRANPMNRVVIGGEATWPLSQALEVMQFYADYSAGAPDELEVGCSMVTPPGTEPVVNIAVCYCGDHAEGMSLVEPIADVGKPIVAEFGPKDYFDMQIALDEVLRHGRRYYIKSGFVKEFSGELAREIVEGFQANPFQDFFTMHSGGAINRVPQDATAFTNRSAAAGVFSMGSWEDAGDDENNIGIIRAYWKKMEPFTDGYYVNLNEEAGAKVAANYGSNYPRLVEVKNKYDPANLFHLNTNIKPTA